MKPVQKEILKIGATVIATTVAIEIANYLKDTAKRKEMSQVQGL